MSISYASEHRWLHMATVEVRCNVANFAQLIQDNTLQFQVEPAGKSPPGVQWFLLFMDLSCGERRAARTAWAVLTALQKSAAAGCLDGFRIVTGAQWLSLDEDAATDGSAMRRDVRRSGANAGAALCAR